MKTNRHIRILAGLLSRTAGSHVYHRELALALAARGYRVSVVSFEDDSTVAETCEVRSVGPLPGPLPVLLWRHHAWFRYRHCRRRLRAMKLDQPDVVIAGEHLFLPDHPKLFPTVPWVYLPHSLVLSHEIGGYGMPRRIRERMLRIYRRIQQWALEHADRTLRFTKYGCKVLTDDYGGAIQPRYEVNPFGVHLPNSVTSCENKPVPNVLAVGSLIPGKRIDVAIRALGELRDIPWEFEVVGDGPEREKVEALTRELNISDRVHCHGHQADPMRWYEKANLLVVPSRSESLGLVILEAMSHGVPVLGMRADGRNFFNPSEELIKDGVDGFLADSDAQLRDRLRELLTNQSILRRVGIEARRTVEQRFTWDKHLNRHEALFDELMTDRGGR